MLDIFDAAFFDGRFFRFRAAASCPDIFTLDAFITLIFAALDTLSRFITLMLADFTICRCRFRLSRFRCFIFSLPLRRYFSFAADI